MSRSLLPFYAAALLAAAGCTQTASPPPTPSIIGPTVAPTFQTAAGGGCAGEVARYRSVMANDLATGHVNKGVHARVSAEIDRAAAVCAAGRDAEAVRIIDATKLRYGYR
jgi:hypothetical protein